ncbi:hypothetical protein AB1Y20_022319 [Prymnesium parvum]|uniref:Uncharacterized protein n=1 Tax=Prymnesium parvum TaxID=97485 RepID=A0AB34JIG9_PRYPA
MHGGLAALLVLGGCLVGLFVDRLVVPLAVQQMQQSAGRVGSGEHSSELTVADEHNTFHSNSHMVLQSVVKEESHLGSGVHAARQWRPSQVPPCGEPPLGTELQTNVEVGKREVEYEIVEAASASQHREGAVALVQQTLSAIPTQTEIKAAEKPVPWESELSSVALLADEAEETASFVHRVASSAFNFRLIRRKSCFGLTHRKTFALAARVLPCSRTLAPQIHFAARHRRMPSMRPLANNDAQESRVLSHHELQYDCGIQVRSLTAIRRTTST